MTPAPAAAQIAAFLARPDQETPDAAVAAAQVVLLNGLRAVLVARDEPLARRLIASKPAIAASGGGAAVLWSGARADPEHAVLCNQFAWTLLLMDDVELASGLHPGGPAAIGALARAQDRPVSGRRLLTAIVAGIEVQIAVALAGAPEMLQVRGFAPLSVLAPLGAAAAGAVVDALPADQAAQVIGIAAMSGAGMWEMGGTSSATYLTARGAASGLGSLQAAACGIEPPQRALDGPFGAYHAYTGKPLETLHDQLATLGSVWRTPQVLVQPYSGDTYTQAPLEAVARILVEGAIAPDDIDAVIVRANERAAVGVTRKAARHSGPADAVGFNSDPTGRIAAALVRGVYSWDGTFDALTRDPAVVALRARTRFEVDPTIADITGAAVEVHLAGGEVRRARVDGFTGSAHRPQTFAGMAAAFRADADARIGAGRAQRVVEAVAGLAQAGDVAELLDAVG